MSPIALQFMSENFARVAESAHESAGDTSAGRPVNQELIRLRAVRKRLWRRGPTP